MKLSRQIYDRLFTRLVAAVSVLSAAALAAIIGFVFVQGAEPFIGPTAKTVRLVAERIDRLSVNGVFYDNGGTFIDLNEGTEEVEIEFADGEGTRKVNFAIDYSEVDPRLAVRFIAADGAEKKYPEAYVHSLIYPGAIAALSKKIHILLPEPAYGLGAFLGGLSWRPSYDKVYGILPMIVATILATAGAAVIAVPLALLASVFMAEFLPPRLAALVRGGIDLLAGIPSVVYGFFGLMVVVPGIKAAFHAASGSSLLAASLILAIMILPTIVAVAETSLRAVPRAYREASLALGATKVQTAWRVVVPPSRSGIIAGIILGVSRAVGETMAVILVAGNSSQLPSSPLDSVRTLTATIALEMGYAQGRHNQMLFSVGIVLFTLILILNAFIMRLKRRSPEAV